MRLDHRGAGIKVKGTGIWIGRPYHHGNPSQDAGFNSLARTPGDGASPMWGWWLGAWGNPALTLCRLERAELLWQRLKGDLKRLEDVGKL